MVCSPTYHVRVIVLAPSIDAARNALGRDAIDQMQHVWVRPLAMRSTEIDRLLDRIFAERHAKLRAADLTPANLAALRTYGWPDNLAGLRRIADEILAHATHHGLRPAARSLGMPTSTLHSHLVGVGLAFPLFAG
jgi:transcriptional regulator with AAA-type ATPase domain